jgi:hypothetical protein
LNVSIVHGKIDVGGQLNNPLNKQIGGKHYKVWKVQPVNFIRNNKLPFIFGVMIKYIMRIASNATSTPKKLEDLDKIIHYAEIEKEFIRKHDKE